MQNSRVSWIFFCYLYFILNLFNLMVAQQISSILTSVHESWHLYMKSFLLNLKKKNDTVILRASFQNESNIKLPLVIYIKLDYLKTYSLHFLSNNSPHVSRNIKATFNQYLKVIQDTIVTCGESDNIFKTLKDITLIYLKIRITNIKEK